MGFFTSSRFLNDPYGWLTNQIGHAFFVGCIVLVFLPTVVCFVVMGEFPIKLWVIIGGAVAYLTFELATQGWKGADTIEDFVFVVGYGVTGTMASFTEIAPGNPVTAFDLFAALPYVAIMTAHLAFGAWLRSRG